MSAEGSLNSTRVLAVLQPWYDLLEGLRHLLPEDEARDKLAGESWCLKLERQAERCGTSDEAGLDMKQLAWLQRWARYFRSQPLPSPAACSRRTLELCNQEQARLVGEMEGEQNGFNQEAADLCQVRAVGA